MVGETNDGGLNDIRARVVTAADVVRAIETATPGPVEQGAVGAVTGTIAFGFKGGWLALWLQRLGASVYGYALPPPTAPSNYALSNVRDVLCGETLADIRDRALMREAMAAFRPDVVFQGGNQRECGGGGAVGRGIDDLEGESAQPPAVLVGILAGRSAQAGEGGEFER